MVQNGETKDQWYHQQRKENMETLDESSFIERSHMNATCFVLRKHIEMEVNGTKYVLGPILSNEDDEEENNPESNARREETYDAMDYGEAEDNDVGMQNRKSLLNVRNPNSKAKKVAGKEEKCQMEPSSSDIDENRNTDVEQKQKTVAKADDPQIKLHNEIEAKVKHKKGEEEMEDDLTSKIKADPNSKMGIRASLPQIKRIMKRGLVRMEKIKLKWKFFHIKKIKKFGYTRKDEIEKDKINRLRGERIGQKGLHHMYKVIEPKHQLGKDREGVGGSKGLFW